MNLQENIDRIKQMMGILNENNELRLRRLLSVIDDLVEYCLNDIYTPKKVCEHYINSYELVDVIAAWIVERMFNRYFDIDDTSKEWEKIHDMINQYIQEHHSERIQNHYFESCGKEPKIKISESEIPASVRRRLPSELLDFAVESAQEKISNGYESKNAISIVAKEVVFHFYLTANAELDFDPNRFTIMIKEIENYIKSKLGYTKGEQTESEITERCWKGYTQKGMKTMFGKRYPNCVKKKK
jgi:hypothetical protein